MDRIFKLTVVCLLAGILGMLVAVYLRIPNSAPTLADLQKADAETRQNLLMHRPLVFVEGTVDIGYTPLEVEGGYGNTPLEVTGGYTPLEVEIVRWGFANQALQATRYPRAMADDWKNTLYYGDNFNVSHTPAYGGLLACGVARHFVKAVPR